MTVFGESYLYAFDYLLGPGGGPRSLEYPSVLDRNGYIQLTATEVGCSFGMELFSDWADSGPLPPELQQVASITDEAVRSFAPRLIILTTDLAKSKGIGFPAEPTIQDILRCYERHLPYQRTATLPEILSAGWRRLRAMGGLGHEAHAEDETLNELVLKSIEISEFLNLAV